MFLQPDYFYPKLNRSPLLADALAYYFDLVPASYPFMVKNPPIRPYSNEDHLEFKTLENSDLAQLFINKTIS